ncbi:hypothetical protein TTRE_0000908401 [Trichuris trichiura]|uniref:Uncharacterized protein n=1 Tax=Trichuris trichiura TaxID=36087 RepID=A0A077ZLS8_TRITR|nr:hypothetical protein TTRE_0000908401 [Trichuris trichiura]
MSHLTSQISTVLSSFSDQLLERLTSLHEHEIVNPPSSLLGESRLLANHANMDSLTLIPTSSSSCVSPPSEKVQQKSEQLSQRLNDNIADRAQPIMRSSVILDGWISKLVVPSPTSFSTPPSWLREIAPAVNIELFDGDPVTVI